MTKRKTTAAKKTLVPPDIIVENHGSVALLRPMTDAGREWIDENVPTEGWQWLGGALSCEPRYVENIVEGATGDGLVVG
jgi:hypothetical protein